ncbi:MAG: hypothetical protein ABI592_12580 [Acidobacteriota bacterium]
MRAAAGGRGSALLDLTGRLARWPLPRPEEGGGKDERADLSRSR